MAEQGIYVTRPNTVEAFRYGPEFYPGLVDELASFIAGRPVTGDLDVMGFVQPAPEPWDPPDPEYSTVQFRAGRDGESGWVSLWLGAWVARNVGDLGDHWPVNHEHFVAKYAAVSDG